MARKYRCKCKATGELGDTLSFIKTKYGYFKSQYVYDEWLKQKEVERQDEEDRKELLDKISVEYFNHPAGAPAHPFLAKKIKELKPYSYKVIMKTVEECHNDIIWAINNKQFNSEQQQISYIFAILVSKIGIIYNKHKKEAEKRIKDEHNLKHTDMSAQIMVDDLNSEKKQNHLNENKDLTRFLDGEEE